MLDRTLQALVRPWRARRSVVIVELLFCAGIILYLAIGGQDTALHRDINQMAWVTMLGITGSYVFGAVWDDADIRKRAVQAGRPDDFSGDHP